MSLVLYPDSDSDGPDGQAQPVHHTALSSPDRNPGALTDLKRKRSDGEGSALPPLPAAFHDLYSTNARISTSDDPSLHGGRKRAMPHVEGNWPSHVYLEWVPSHTESETLHRLIQSIREAIERANKRRAKPLPVPDITPSLRSPLGAPLPLHISLSRTLQIKTEDRQAFQDTLTSCLRKATVRPFRIRFSTLKWVSNFQRNRWFLVLGIEKPPHNELNRLLEACNVASEKCGHPGLYTGGSGDGPMERNTSTTSAKKRRKSNAKAEHADSTVERVDRTDNFHISIAWNLVEPAPEWISLVGDIDVNAIVNPPQAPFDVVKARIGNIVHNVELSAKALSGSDKGSGILGLG